jgi:hypothetical protein
MASGEIALGELPRTGSLCARLSLLIFGRPARRGAKKVSGCRAAPGKGIDGRRRDPNLLTEKRNAYRLK